MFKIGEFAQIGRVTGRQLRHYDRLGLLQPSYTDPQTGYRFYSAQQLPRLNRILALKALGFSLDQIASLIDNKTSSDELRGMLSMRKAQVEQSLAEEQIALRQIESRIQQIEEQGSLQDYDVVIRSEPAQLYASVRQAFPNTGEAIELLKLIAQKGATRIKPAHRDKLTIVAYSDFDDEGLDLEIGFTLTQAVNAPLRLAGDVELKLRELEEIQTMAALVRTGPNYQTHLAYGALGVWMEANNYEIAGLCREVFLEPPFTDPKSDEVVMEIQFPVKKVA